MSASTELLQFIKKSPTAFQAVDTMKAMLKEAGYTELSEGERWKLKKGTSYFVERGGSALAAFTVPKTDFKGFRVIASHSDSPYFKIKENPEISVENAYIKLNTEKYGGMLMAPWFDRPLSVAGRVIVRTKAGLVPVSVNLDADVAVIPNLAIHMNREANEGYKFNAQKDMLPLFALSGEKGSFMNMIAEAAGVEEKDICGHDLYLVNHAPGSVWGTEEEFVSAPRLDDLECVFCSVKAHVKAKKSKYAAIHVVFDNEEVGSSSKQGAASTFLEDLMERIENGLNRDREQYLMDLTESFMLSADNAHAFHPNYQEKADPVNHPIMGKGIVLKFNANQKYCTDGMSAAMFRELCRKVKVPVQEFTNRSDVAGGSTLGNISNLKVPMLTADIGLAQLAMHSPYETAATKDVDYMIKAMTAFFE